MARCLLTMLLLQPTAGLVIRSPLSNHGAWAARAGLRSSPIRAQEAELDSPKTEAAPDKEEGDGAFWCGFGAAAGLVANPIVFVSLYNVAATGVGLPAGPYDLVGGLEGVSFLIVTAVLGAAAVSKVQTGSGLPAGPLGLLGLSEGLSFLSLLLAVLVFPLRELGIVGDPSTSAVNVPELAESLRVLVVPLIASASAALSAVLSDGLGGLPEMPAVPAMPAMPSLALPDGLPELPKSMPALPDGIALPKEIPALSMPSLPEGLPSLPSMPSMPEGLPSMPSMPELSAAPPPEPAAAPAAAGAQPSLSDKFGF